MVHDIHARYTPGEGSGVVDGDGAAEQESSEDKEFRHSAGVGRCAGNRVE